MGEYLVNEALPLAIASVRDEQGCSPVDAADTLVRLHSLCHELALM